MLSDILEIIKALAIVSASCVAIYGINSWRRETRWKVKYNLAEDVLTLVYEIQDSIRAIRSPGSYSGEGQTRPKSESETKSEAELRDRAYVALERYEKDKESFNKLNAAKYRFMAVYGKEHKELFTRLNVVVTEIIGAGFMLGRVYWPKQGTEQMSEDFFQRHLKEMHKYEAIYWWQGDEDETSLKVKAIVDEFENLCGPIIRKEQEQRYFDGIFRKN